VESEHSIYIPAAYMEYIPELVIRTLCGLTPKDIITQWELNLIRKIIFIPIYLTFRPVVSFDKFDFEIVHMNS
jgi:predicted nuclease of restriction endonuclease-like RecB superfamily